MILKALNGDKLARYGYDDELVYTNDTFHGHQIGISIGVTNTLTNDIVHNYISETQGDETERNRTLKAIIDDTSIVKIEKPITQFENGTMVQRTIWMLPYAAIEHSAFRETLNFSNIVSAENATNHVVVELLFVHDSLNRYLTVSFDTVDVSIMDVVHDLFEYPNELEEWTTDIKYVKDDERGTGYCLDFYDEAGEKIVLHFPTLWDLRDAIVSVRLLEVNTIIEGD